MVEKLTFLSSWLENVLTSVPQCCLWSSPENLRVESVKPGVARECDWRSISAVFYCERVRAMNDEGYSNDEAVRFLGKCVGDAAKAGASDIHFEHLTATSAFGPKVSVRFRISGRLEDSVEELPVQLYEKIIGYLQDISGPISGDSEKPSYAIVSARKFSTLDGSLGCCIIPKVDGGRDIVIRLLAGDPLPLESLEYRPFEVQAVKNVSYGIVLFSGPTGSGRQTGLSAFLHDMRKDRLKVWSIKEDAANPIFSHLSEIDASPGSDNSYEDWMRISVNRMDPDVIHIGSLKGPEKLPLAVEVALDGVTVMADMHADSACDAVLRYMDLGQKVYNRMLMDALAAVVCQQLMKKLCQHCKVPVQLDEKEIKRLLITYHTYPENADGQFDVALGKSTYTRWLQEYGDSAGALFRYQPKGCSECGGSGYKGKAAISEAIVVSPKMRELFLAQPTSEAILKLAINGGTSTLRQNAIEKALGGVLDLSQIDPSIISQVGSIQGNGEAYKH